MNDEETRYFFLCQQFIHMNIQDPELAKILIAQLKNYMDVCPQDLRILYIMWIDHQPISQNDILGMLEKKKISFIGNKK